MVLTVKNTVEVDDELRVGVLVVLGVSLGVETLTASVGRVEGSACWHDHGLGTVSLELTRRKWVLQARLELRLWNGVAIIEAWNEI